jgi:hypothetical protein
MTDDKKKHDDKDRKKLSDEEMEDVAGGSAFVKLGDIKGEATDADHKDWIIVDSMGGSPKGKKGVDGGDAVKDGHKFL